MKYTDIIIDLDGVLYRGQSAVPHAVEAFNEIPPGIRKTLFTNTTTKSVADIAGQLSGMGFQAKAEEVVTSLLITLELLKRLRPEGPLFVIGSDTLRSTLKGKGYVLTTGGRADFVVMGLDQEITYDKLRTGLQILERGARLILTNPNVVFPMEDGLVPGPGAVAAAFAAMGHPAEYVCGKPEPEAMRTGLQLRGISPGPHCLMVGDHLETDIQGAVSTGMDSALVLTGVSNRDDVVRTGIQPDYIIEDLRELIGILRQ